MRDQQACVQRNRLMRICLKIGAILPNQRGLSLCLVIAPTPRAMRTELMSIASSIFSCSPLMCMSWAFLAASEIQISAECTLQWLCLWNKEDVLMPCVSHFWADLQFAKQYSATALSPTKARILKQVKPTAAVYRVRDPLEVMSFLTSLVEWGRSEDNAWHQAKCCSGWRLNPNSPQLDLQICAMQGDATTTCSSETSGNCGEY